MSGYKVKVLSNAVWRKFKSARLDVSLQNTKQIGEKFETALLWAIDNFEHVEISLADTLQRHTFSADYNVDIEKSNNMTIREGDVWIDYHRDLLEKHNIPVIRWNERISHVDFEQYHQMVRELYLTNLEFKKLVNDDCNSFIQRRSYSENKRLFVLNYILEEQAVFAMLSQKENSIGIYPGSILGCYRGQNRPELFKNTEFCKIDFLRNKKLV